MKALIVYESFFGNTEKIAKIIFEKISEDIDCTYKNVVDLEISDFENIDLLIAGSPTRAFHPTEKFAAFFKSLPHEALKGIKSAAFDTRVDKEDIDSKFLRFAVNFGGYAAKPIDKLLIKKGTESIIEPIGFFVIGEEGPLKDGEIEKAQKWANEILKTIK